ncbi:MAG: N-6 DNA methylase [Candidatus Delongbacteria bacterium]|nr:N-6 DNA methylase [Candidatus Delongbacteria bacterium]
MINNELIKVLGFAPQENTSGIFIKKYPFHDNYAIKIDIENESFDYGKKIKAESKTTQNFSQEENWVVLECVNRLLEKGYEPQHIILEKTWATGHGTSGRLDILVTKKDKSAFMMIECKTLGKEYAKELNKTLKDGGQLFTYFQQDRYADYLVLYASGIDAGKIAYKNSIVKIQDDYRQTSNVKDLYELWNKIPKDNGIFDNWTTPYHFESLALTPESLIDITQNDSNKIFNRFLEILRHNVVSDKPNAFNKVFTLFLCKIYDEWYTKPGNELKFQWLEGRDNNISFQKRLTDLYRSGMKQFLEKEVTDLSESDFEKKYGSLNPDIKQKILDEITEIRLKKNNEFAIKEVFDDDSFVENAKVVKEVVELLQGYKIRYTKKQQYLSDFFELLLTTGLKQESGQFFTPVPIAQFIIRSLPIDVLVKEKLEKGLHNDLLPTVIDYAAGSGHFLTESMHVIQSILDKTDETKFIRDTAKKVEHWKQDHFDWAYDYIYGVEKDYRLVKVGKVGCYLHGDGLARVVHSDGLGNFTNTKEYQEKLSVSNKNFPQDNQQFDIVVSNPPYSVSAFRNNARKYYSDEDFTLYNKLTDQSSEIECLFVERTKQLLKDGGVAGVILPSSILNNTGLYTKTREIIFRYFEIIAIAELGSNTFMATGTNTVVLFMRRRNNYDAINFENMVKNIFTTFKDNTINGIEKPVTKYVTHTWEGLSVSDYFSLLKRQPNETIQAHELYREYSSKISGKSNTSVVDEILEREKEKLLYFILTYHQKVVLVRTGEKKEEKAFLGYEFSNRRGCEGIHPVQIGRTIDNCTKLYDPEFFENPKKASTYIYDSFIGNFSRNIDESLKDNVRRLDLVDMLTFDRVEFEKTISLFVKKKVTIESKWEVFQLNKLMTIVRGGSPRPIKKYLTNDVNGVNWIKIGDVTPESKYITHTKEKIIKEGVSKSRFVNLGDFILSNSMSFGRPYIMKTTGCIHDGWLLLTNFDDRLNKDFLYYILSDKLVQDQFNSLADGGTTVDNLNIDRVSSVRIPLPPIKIQDKFVEKISGIEEFEETLSNKIKVIEEKILSDFRLLSQDAKNTFRLSDSGTFKITIGKRVLSSEIDINNLGIPVYSANVFTPFGYINKKLFNDFSIPSVIWGIDGDWMVNLIPSNQPFYPTDHCGVLRILNKDINPRYIAWALYQAGKDVRFSRNHRASIDRIKGLSIRVPSLKMQDEIMQSIEASEKQIEKLKNELKVIPEKKRAILNEFL